MDFPMVYVTAILNEHPFLVIFKHKANFWAEWEVGGAGKKMFGLKRFP